MFGDRAFSLRPLVMMAIGLMGVFSFSVSWALNPPILHTELLEVKLKLDSSKLEYEARFYPTDCVDLGDLTQVGVVLEIGDTTLTVPRGKLEKTNKGYRYVVKHSKISTENWTLWISTDNRIGVSLSGKETNFLDPYDPVQTKLTFIWVDSEVEFIEKNLIDLSVSGSWLYLYRGEPGPDCGDLCTDIIAQPIELQIFPPGCETATLEWTVDLSDPEFVQPDSFILYMLKMPAELVSINVGHLFLYTVASLQSNEQYLFYVVGITDKWGCESFPSSPVVRDACESTY